MIGARLKVLRKQNGYTQLEMANKIGVSKVAYTLYETNKNYPTYPNLLKIIGILKTSLDYYSILKIYH